MKILFTSKKQIILNIITILLISIFLFFTFSVPHSFAIELVENSIMSDELMSKISNITKNKEKIVYLTFDDGPTISATPRILDILKEENIKATFFVIGKYVEKHPEIVKRAYEEGHYIANHGYDHNNAILYKSKDSFLNEVKKTDIAIGKAIGISNYCAHIFRFPNGFMSANNKGKKKEALKLLNEINYTYIDWNCLNKDSEKKYSNYQLLANLKKTAKNKGTLVVLMHDTTDVNNSSLILKDSISYLKSEGYEFDNFYSLIEE